MSYRKNKNEWSELIRAHRADLRACGIPDFIYESEMRFFAFLDHGYDEYGWAKDQHNCFDSRNLSEEELSRLADFVTRHVDASYEARIRSGWRRGRTED